MVYADFSGREIVKALRAKRYVSVGRTGSHVKLRDEHPETEALRQPEDSRRDVLDSK